MKPTLIVRVFGGLGNRLRALLSAASYADATGRRFYYVWLPDPECGSALDELWVRPFHSIPWGPVRVLGRIVGHTPAAELEFDDPRRVIVLGSTRTIFADDPRLVPFSQRLRALRPTADVARRIVDTWSAGWKERPTVGVMIRCDPTAHVKTREASPPDWFVRRMREIREAHPDVVFFLSTDEQWMSDAIHAQFDDVFELAGKFALNLRTEVKDAVCDLYLAAMTNYILGSHWSSFSMTARLLADHGGFESSRMDPLTPLDTRLAAPVDPTIFEICSEAAGLGSGAAPAARPGGADSVAT